MKNVILASKSPRRMELVKKFGIEAQSFSADIDETVPQSITVPNEVVKYLAEKKARFVAEKFENDVIIIGADTLVFAENRVLGKPSTVFEAANMMNILSGKSHSVISGICIICGSKKICESVETRVTFRHLSKEEIDGYVSTREPYDKAGGYGIQALAGAFVSEIHGDYYNVVGLPMSRLLEILKNEFGYDALKNIFQNGDAK